MEHSEQSVKLTKKDVNKSFWLWQLFSHANYNYERMQGTAFAMCMAPILKKLYPKKDDLVEGLERHLVFFNTDPNLGAVIHGATIAMEEKKANGADISGEAINAFKTGLMGPMAGVGDSLIQGVIIPLFVALGISLGLVGNLAGPLLVLFGLTATLVLISRSSWMRGYELGTSAITNMLQDGRMKTWIGAAGILGTMVMGGLIPQYVGFSTKIAFNIGQVPFDLQANLFDAIMPNMLPLALTLFIYWLTTKRVKTWMILLGVAVVGIAGGALGIF